MRALAHHLPTTLIIPVLCRGFQLRFPNTRLSMALRSDHNAVRSAQALRVLGLHGSGGTADAFQQLLSAWNDSLKYGMQFHIATVQGEIPSEDGFAWWRLGPGERSFTAQSYEGYSQSEAVVIRHLCSGCDLVIAHSQGAILTTALLARGNRQGGQQVRHPRIGYILNGVAWPNPYTMELESLQVSGNPRILMIVGVNDKINPPDQAFRVEQALKKAGCDMTMLLHPGGHALPRPNTCDDDVWEKIQKWIKHEISNDSLS